MKQMSHIHEQAFADVLQNRMMTATLFKERQQHWRFPVNLAKFVRTLFLMNTYRRLLLYIGKKYTLFHNASYLS